MATQDMAAPDIPGAEAFESGTGVYSPPPRIPLAFLDLGGGDSGPQYKMRGMYAPGGTRTRWIYWTVSSPDFTGSGQSEVPVGDLTDIGLAEVING